MTESLRCRLVHYLEELTEEELKKFKLFLEDSSPRERFLRIPRGKMKKADNTDMAELMVHHYGEWEAWEVALMIWEKMGLRELWEQAKREPPQIGKLSRNSRTLTGKNRESERRKSRFWGHVARLKKMWSGMDHVDQWNEGNRRTYRNQIIEKFQVMRDRNSCPGEYENLHHRFTQLLLLQEYRYREQKEHELLASGREHAEIMENQGQLIEVAALFDSDEKRGACPQIVVLQGAAGIGKTTLARKVMLDWAEGNLYQHKFHYVFYVNCREMNHLREKKTRFADLISNNWPSLEDPMTKVLSQPEKLLFVIDGLDELKFPCDEHSFDLCKDWNQQQPVPILLSSLLRKTMLPESSLLITTRLTALGKCDFLFENPRHVEILGFSEEDRWKYFCNFFGDEDQAQQAFSLIANNETLFTMCFVPLMCWIICTCLKQQMRRKKDLKQASKTTTTLYMCYLSSLVTPGNRSFSVQHHRGLCRMAAEGIWEGKILFDGDDLRRHGLEASDVSAFLDMHIFQRDSDSENCYSFIHLSFQEFFAAMFYALGEEKEISDSSTPLIPGIKDLLAKCRDSATSFVSLTVYFLFGFLNADNRKRLEEIFSCKISQEIKLDLLQWIQAGIEQQHKDSYLRNHLLEIFSHLYETQNEDFVTSAIAHFPEISLNIYSKLHYLVSVFCIKFCHNLERIHLNIARFQSKSLQFMVPQLTEVDWQHLFSVLAKKQNLRDLDLSGTELANSAMNVLCSELSQSSFKLQKLSLSKCQITASCCQLLSSLLKNNRSLIYLDLSMNFLGDEGMKVLCEVLRNKNCNIQDLRLSRCHFSNACCKILSSALKAHGRMKYIDLSENNLQDTGMNLLCEALGDPDCNLQELKLSQCHLTAGCCQDLSTCIKNQSLTHLDVSGNFLRDCGMKLLCEALRHPACNLQKLMLSLCHLTDSCCQDISSVLKSNRSLIHLDLGCNSLYNHGVKLLCEALENQDCNLQTLELWNCQISAACCYALSSVLKKNQSLTHLNLGANPLRNNGVKVLCEALGNQNCKLQELKLCKCLLSVAGCRYLSSALKSNQSLIDLKLTGNGLGDDGVKLLLEALRSQDCKLQKLTLDKWKLSADTQRIQDELRQSKPHLIIENSSLC
ncbi:NACHT, LRR and PYD domains-containing protein 3-like [Trichosurus vulpecula]|uniref:NACHT, LRR and PYD domains-containing protein 3-like n=1 Tax=Trichosurus vulpecula TaxID=9337 RepID=UPI00186ACDE9|nr:NACHT, LRR and PYD domains-containing protein 3-like [Trichosurus vulpecula]